MLLAIIKTKILWVMRAGTGRPSQPDKQIEKGKKVGKVGRIKMYPYLIRL